jgi:hypothetical protein
MSQVEFRGGGMGVNNVLLDSWTRVHIRSFRIEYDRGDCDVLIVFVFSRLFKFTLSEKLGTSHLEYSVFHREAAKLPSLPIIVNIMFLSTHIIKTSIQNQLLFAQRDKFMSRHAIMKLIASVAPHPREILLLRYSGQLL